MESQPPFVRADGTVHFDSKTAVHMNIPLVVHPGDTEDDDPFRLSDPFQYSGMPIFRVFIEHRLYGFKHLRTA